MGNFQELRSSLKRKDLSPDERIERSQRWVDSFRKVLAEDIFAVYSQPGYTISEKADSELASVKVLDPHGVECFRVKLRPEIIDPDQKGPELSIYIFKPTEGLDDFSFDRYSQEEMITFIKDPFDALRFVEPLDSELPDDVKAWYGEQLKRWFAQWKKIFTNDDPPYPGYYFKKGIPNASRHIMAKAAESLFNSGFRYMTAVPTWYHTYFAFLRAGFVLSRQEDRDAMEKLNSLVEAKIPNLNVPKEKNPDAWRRIYAKRSWAVMLQFWAQKVEALGFKPEDMIPVEYQQYILRDDDGNIVTYPLSPERNLWMKYELTKESVGALTPKS